MSLHHLCTESLIRVSCRRLRRLWSHPSRKRSGFRNDQPPPSTHTSGSFPHTCDPECLLQRPETSNCPKWLGEGAKGVLGTCRNSLPRVSCTSATLFCTRATLFCTSATGFLPTCTKTPFAPSLKHFGQFRGIGPL